MGREWGGGGYAGEGDTIYQDRWKVNLMKAEAVRLYK